MLLSLAGTATVYKERSTRVSRAFDPLTAPRGYHFVIASKGVRELPKRGKYLQTGEVEDIFP